MTEHTITIDETGDGADQAYRPYCTDECGWQAESWSHVDYQPGYNPADPDTWDAAESLAYAAAQAGGRDHLLTVIARAENDASIELINVLGEVFTPDVPDESATGGLWSTPLGTTSIGGQYLSPDDLDYFADVLRVHASLARLASA